jgi:hypothetical protein
LKLFTNFYKITSDKHSLNLSLLKTFRNDYKRNYDLEIYTIECIAYTLNNIVHDILSFLLYTENDDQEIRRTINSENDEEVNVSTFSKFFFFF